MQMIPKGINLKLNIPSDHQIQINVRGKGKESKEQREFLTSEFDRADPSLNPHMMDLQSELRLTNCPQRSWVLRSAGRIGRRCYFQKIKRRTLEWKKLNQNMLRVKRKYFRLRVGAIHESSKEMKQMHKYTNTQRDKVNKLEWTGQKMEEGKQEHFHSTKK